MAIGVQDGDVVIARQRRKREIAGCNPDFDTKRVFLAKLVGGGNEQVVGVLLEIGAK